MSWEFFDTWEFRQKPKHGCEEKPYPAEWIPGRLDPQVAILHRVRVHFGAPVSVICCYRDPVYNARVKSNKKSQHLVGRATDFRVRGVPARRVRDWIRDEYRAGRMPELGGLGCYAPNAKRRGFVHIDVRKAGRLAVWWG